MKKYLVILSSILILYAIVGELPYVMIDMLLIFSIVIASLMYVHSTQKHEFKNDKIIPINIIYLSIAQIILEIVLTKKIGLEDTSSKLLENLGSIIIGENLYVGMVVLTILVIVQVILLNGISMTSEVVGNFMTNPLQEEIRFYKDLKGAAKYVRGSSIFNLIFMMASIFFSFLFDLSTIYTYIIGAFVCFTFINLLNSITIGMLVTKIYNEDKQEVLNY